ncbi:MAG: lamin tail domain-containing protein [Opitutaceae bacterium]
MTVYSKIGQLLTIVGSLLLFTAASIHAQTVVISELMPDNNVTLLDEDGDSTDWIELYNNSDSPVDLTGWHLTDDTNDLTQWTFPTTSIAARSYLVVFASDKNRSIAGSELHTNFKLSASGETVALVQANGSTVEHLVNFIEADEDMSYGFEFATSSAAPVTLVDSGDPCTAHIPTSAADQSGWQATGFNDGGWLSGTTGVGYHEETPDAYEALIGLNVIAMQDVNPSVYIRVPFTVADTSALSTLTLKMKYDDGFAAYLNGQLVTSIRAPDPLAWNQTGSNHSDNQAIIFQDFDITSDLSSLQNGTNVLAIHGFNTSIDSSDALFLPELEASLKVGDINLSSGGLLQTATPGAINGNVDYEGYVEAPVASPARGFYSTSTSVTLTNTTLGATIYYTTDGSTPTESSTLYTGPISISTTTNLRFAAFINGWRPSYPRTDSYIFAAQVATQAKTTPAAINGQVLSYGMDAGVLAKSYTDSSGAPVTVEDALLDIPSISLTTDHDNLYDPNTGIYVNASERWEVPASAELIYPDGTEGFHVNAALRIRGGASRSNNNLKHSFRIVCRSQYGDSKIKYPLFEDEGVDEFDKIDFRSAQNYSWSKDNDTRNTFLRDVFARDASADMGQGYTRSRYYHLYLNGEYWGLFMTQERAVSDFAASYYGGDPDDYDAVKVDSTMNYTAVATDGNLDAYEDLYDAAMAGFSNNTDYFEVMGLDANGDPDPTGTKLLDVDNLIDYLLVIQYMAASDNAISWFLGRYKKLNNMYASYNRVNPDGFKWFQHDSEHSLDRYKALDWTGPFTDSNFTLLEFFNPMTLHDKLIANAEYRLKFADRAYKHLQNDGVLTLANSEARLDYRAAQIDRAIVANAARWGSTSLDRDTWVSAVATTRAWLARSDDRCNEVIGYLLNDGLIPSTQPPLLSQTGGLVTEGTTISFSESTPIIQPDHTPYPSGVPHAVPGTIGAADFDNGGQSVAYFDTDSGNNDSNNQYRPSEDVDIQDSVIGGYHLGWVQTGEWLKYTVDVATEGDYQIRLKAAANNNNTAASAFHIEVDGVDVTGTIFIDGTGGWENWVDTTSSVGLADREQVITLVIEDGGINVKSIEFVSLGTSNLAITVPTDPSSPTGPGDITYSMYYTTDGTDPRVIGGAIAGTAYSGPITITRPTHLKARTLSSEGEWSALAEGTYWTADIPLAVTELMYHAPEGNSHDLIEVQNISSETVTLKGYKLDDGIDFKFKNSAFSTLAPGEIMVVVDDIDSFNAKYTNSDSVLVAGEFSGDLSNGGEGIDLEFRGEDLITFTYDDARNWPQSADGGGHSLVPIDSAMHNQEDGSLNYGGNWRASTYYGGSPGEVDPVLSQSVLLNEIIAHTDTGNSAPFDSNDVIELYNPTASAIDLTGYFLSDDSENPYQWAIPNGTMIPAYGFLAFDEDDYHSDRVNGFGLNKAGEEVFLSTASGMLDSIRFKGQENGASYGRYPDGSDHWMLTVPTRDAANALPAAGLQISEIMYHPLTPGNDHEYVVIENTGSGSITFTNSTGNFRIDGDIDFDFPSNTTLGSGEKLWLVSFDPLVETTLLSSFTSTYGISANDILGPYSNSLPNDAGRVALERAQDSDDPLNSLDVSWIVVDEVFYADGSPWPSAADGSGFPLVRTGLNTWGAQTTDDTDADGMDDAWEMTHFSSLTQAKLDWDDDGFSNYEEYIAGTDPTDVNSRFTANTTSTADLSWPVMPGRVYSVYWTDELGTPFQLIATGLTTGTYTDTEHSLSDNNFYYISTELE